MKDLERQEMSMFTLLNATNWHQTLPAIAAASSLALCGLTFADDDHNDIEVELANGSLFTEGRVFEGVFGNTGIPFFTDDPGFEGDTGVFMADTVIGFNITSGLGIWNGAGFDMLDPDSQETLTLSFGPSNATTSTGFVSGFDFISDAENGFDVHLDFTLNGFSGDPADGIYLLALELTSNNYATSQTFWIVFDNNMGDEMLDEAADWVQANLVPVPGAVALFAAALLAGRTRRRRAIE